MSEQELSVSQACEIARQMADHFRAFTQVHQVLEKAMVSRSYVDELEAQLAMLKPQVDVWVNRRNDVQEKCALSEAAYSEQVAAQQADFEAKQSQMAQTLATLSSQAQARTKQMQEEHSALMYLQQQDLAQMEAQRDGLITVIAGLQERKKAFAKELGAFVGDSNNG